MPNKNNVQLLVQRAKDLMTRSGGDFTPPAWMLDEDRVGDTPLTPQEQQEWAECACKSMRSCEALLYLIDCEERWGMRDDCGQFVDGDVAMAINKETIELLLQTHLESAVITEEPQKRYLAVFQFYQAENARREAGERWMRDFIDDIFRQVAADIRANDYQMPTPPARH